MNNQEEQKNEINNINDITKLNEEKIKKDKETISNKLQILEQEEENKKKKITEAEKEINELKTKKLQLEQKIAKLEKIENMQIEFLQFIAKQTYNFDKFKKLYEDHMGEKNIEIIKTEEDKWTTFPSSVTMRCLISSGQLRTTITGKSGFFYWWGSFDKPIDIYFEEKIHLTKFIAIGADNCLNNKWRILGIRENSEKESFENKVELYRNEEVFDEPNDNEKTFIISENITESFRHFQFIYEPNKKFAFRQLNLFQMKEMFFKG